MEEPSPAFGDELARAVVLDIVSMSSLTGLSAWEDRRIPLVIGVTGHRDLRAEDIDKLHQKVRGILLDFRKKFPSTPLTVLSPLADGADRLVARVALELREQCPGEIRLVVPLPMPEHLYTEDFADDSLIEFHQLLAAADDHFELPLLRGNTDENIERDRQYREVGKYVVLNCQVLIALWNGEDTNLAGGTSEVVRFKTEGLEELDGFQGWGQGQTEIHTLHRSLLEPAECGPVYQIVTPRREHPGLKGEPLSLFPRYPSMFPSKAKARNYYAKIRKNVDDFNRDAAAPDQTLSREMADSRGYLLRPAEEQDLSPRLRALLERYSVADSLAVRFGKVRSTQGWLHVCVLLALVCFELFAHFSTWWQEIWKNQVSRTPDWGWHLERVPILLLLAVVLYGVALAFFGVAKKRNYQDRYQDYRALAEGLRIQFFWRLAGLPDSVAQYYLGKHRSELDWIRNAIGNWNIPPSPVEANARIDFVVEHWVREQYRYFRKTKDEKKGKWMANGVKALLVAAGVAALLLVAAACIWPVLTEDLTKDGRQHGWAVTVITLLVIGAGLGQHYAEKMAFREHAKEYGHMKTLFSHALERIEQAQDEHQKARLIRDLGIAALEENGHWVLIHRERPLEVPYG